MSPIPPGTYVASDRENFIHEYARTVVSNWNQIRPPGTTELGMESNVYLMARCHAATIWDLRRALLR